MVKSNKNEKKPKKVSSPSIEKPEGFIKHS